MSIFGKKALSVTLADMAAAHTAAMRQILEPEKPSETVQQIDSEILAWRGWALDGDADDPTLLSFNGVRWDGPTLTADRVPEIGSPHGIYALRTRVGDYFSRAAYGQVALTGTVVEGEKGYRAERATIRSLWLANPGHYGAIREQRCAWEIAGMLEQKYEVEVLVATENWMRMDAQDPYGMAAQQQYFSAQQQYMQAAMMNQQGLGVMPSHSTHYGNGLFPGKIFGY